MKHRRVYRMLINNGHSAIMAAQIVLDAGRGDKWAIGWIKRMFRMRHKWLSETRS